MADEVETGASAAPTETAATPSPTPSEGASAPEKPSRFAALMADGEDIGEDRADEAEPDGEGTDTAEESAPAAEEPGKAEKPEGEKTPEPEDEDVPKDLKQVFKKFPNLRGAYYHQRDIMPLGISVEEAKEYRTAIQSLDDLRYTVSRAQQLEAFEGLFKHSDESAPEKFLEVLHQVDDGAANRFVKTLASRLQTIAPEAFYEIGGKAWETGLSRLENLASDDAYRKEAVATIREMIEELSSGKAPVHAPAPLPNPDADELAKRRTSEAEAEAKWWGGLYTAGNQAADREVRALVDDVVKRRDPDGLLVTPDVLEKIVNEVHRSVSGSGAVQAFFKQAIHDVSIPPDQRIAKAAALVKARAENVVELAFQKQTDGIAERLRKASQLKLGKAAKVVSIREATGGRPATESAPPPPKGARMSSKDIFRAVMKG